MISTKTLQKYPFFTELNQEQLIKLVNVAREDTIEEGQFVCEIGKKLEHFFIIVTGKLEVLFELPKINIDYESLGQPSQLEKEIVNIGQIGPGDICGWSALVPPHISTSSVRSLTSGTIISFDCTELIKFFEDDCRFGYFMFQAAAQAIGKRLKAIYDQPIS